MRTPDYWEPSENIEDRRRDPAPWQWKNIREKRLGAIYDQVDDADARQGIQLQNEDGTIYDPNASIQAFVGKGNTMDPVGGGGGGIDPSGFIARLGKFATPELGMMILNDPQKAIEMLAGRGIPLMHSDFGGGGPTAFPPSPSYPPAEPVPGPGGVKIPAEAPGSRPQLGSPPASPQPAKTAPPMPSIPAPVGTNPAPGGYDPTDPFAPTMPTPPNPSMTGAKNTYDAPPPAPAAPQRPPMAPPPDWSQVGQNIKDWFSPSGGTPAPGTPPAGTPPTPQQVGGGGWDQAISGILRQFIPGGDKLDPNRPALAQPAPQAWPFAPTPPPGSSMPYNGMDPQDYNTPAPAPIGSSLPYNGMDPEDYNTPGPAMGELSPVASSTSLAPKAPGAANGLAQALQGLKAVEPGKGNIPGTPPPPHPTNGNNLGDLIQMITAGSKGGAGGAPIDSLGMLLAKGRL